MPPFYLISPLILQTIIWPGTRLCLWFFVHLEVRGLENLKELKKGAVRKGDAKKGIIFAGNHGSELDPILLPASLPFLSRFMPIFYTSREKSFYDDMGAVKKFIYGGFFFKLWGSHAVQVGLHDYEKSLATHIKILAAGKSVFIFPEGGIHNSLSPAKGGLAFLAIHSGVPIVPVAISDIYRLTAKDFFLRRRHIVLEFLPPIFPENIILQKTLTGETDYTRASQTVVDEIGKVVVK